MTRKLGDQTVIFNQHFDAPIDKVFEFMLDHENFGRIWPGEIRRIKDASQGENPNGLGSIRSIKTGPMTFEETICTCDTNQTIEYFVSRGGPIKNHLGRMEFRESNAGTDLHYVIRFDGRIPGTGRIIAGILRSDWSKGIVPIAKELSQ